MLSIEEFERRYPSKRWLAEGGYAEIYESPNRTVVKEWKDSSDINSAIREIYLLKQIESPYIIPILNYTNLKMALPRGRKLECREWRTAIFNVLCALEFLHGHNIIHFDTRVENIVVVDDVPMLIDFGMAIFTPNGGVKSRLWKGHLYDDPSVDEVYDLKFDIYTLARSIPGSEEILRTMRLPQDIRPSASELLKHQYFEGMVKRESRMTLPLVRELRESIEYKVIVDWFLKLRETLYVEDLAIERSLQLLESYDPLTALVTFFIQICLTQVELIEIEDMIEGGLFSYSHFVAKLFRIL